MLIEQVSISDIPDLVPLFDGYIRFYKGNSDPVKFKAYLSERISRGEAIVFIARLDDDKAVGFTLLYPTFSSVSQARIYVLNDLFVHPEYRKKGIAKDLMRAASEFGRTQGAVRLHLETQEENKKAQRLYETTGWKKEIGYYHYNLEL